MVGINIPSCKSISKGSTTELYIMNYSTTLIIILLPFKVKFKFISVCIDCKFFSNFDIMYTFLHCNIESFFS